jgi:hypothetical protein
MDAAMAASTAMIPYRSAGSWWGPAMRAVASGPPTMVTTPLGTPVVGETAVGAGRNVGTPST